MSSVPSEPAQPATEKPGSSDAGEPAAAPAVAPAVEAPAVAGSEAVPPARRRRNPLIYFWVYSLARVSLYLVLWGLLWLFGLGGLVGAAVALLLSIPLSFVLLARPRSAMTASMMERLNVRQERTAALDQELSGGKDPDD